MVVLGVLTWIGLELLGVPYALAFGVFTGAVAIVPFFGTLFSTLLPALFVLGTGGAMQAFWVVLLGIGVHAFEANIVAPMIMERQVHLPPVLSILAVLIMAHLLHLIGLLVAVPGAGRRHGGGRRVYVHRVLEGRASAARSGTGPSSCACRTTAPCWSIPSPSRQHPGAAGLPERARSAPRPAAAVLAARARPAARLARAAAVQAGVPRRRVAARWPGS
jgi:hypothetical protein